MVTAVADGYGGGENSLDVYVSPSGTGGVSVVVSGGPDTGTLRSLQAYVESSSGVQQTADFQNDWTFSGQHIKIWEGNLIEKQCQNTSRHRHFEKIHDQQRNAK